MRQPIPIDQRIKIHKLRLKGVPYKQIAKEVNASVGAVMYWARMYDGRDSTTAIKYAKPKKRPAKTYKEYLWDGYQRNGDPYALATLQRRFPKYLAKKMGVKYIPHKQLIFTII